MATNVGIFQQVSNAVLDLQQSTLQSFEMPLKALGRLLKHGELTIPNRNLTSKVDLQQFLETSDRTGGGMVGSSQLAWPEDPEQVMGLTIVLVEKFADDPDFAIDFCHRYYYSGSKLIAGIHAFVRLRLIPFFRDYKDYVLNQGNIIPKLIVQTSRRIFIVHGHDGEARETVARFLERLGFEPIILHEQANQGRTVIEKVENSSDVGFAVVLLTPDDEGCNKGEPLEPRARQNVLCRVGLLLREIRARSSVHPQEGRCFHS